MLAERLRASAPLVLRVGLAAVYLWFGYQQLTNGAAWTVWVPEWALVGGLTAETIVMLNGWMEVVLGLILLSGFLTFWVAAILAAHIFVIAFDIGLSATGVRDFGLAVATLALALMHLPALSWSNGPAHTKNL